MEGGAATVAAGLGGLLAGFVLGAWRALRGWGERDVVEVYREDGRFVVNGTTSPALGEALIVEWCRKRGERVPGGLGEKDGCAS